MTIRHQIPDAVILKCFTLSLIKVVCFLVYIFTHTPTYTCPHPLSFCPSPVLPQLALAGRKQGQGRPASAHLTVPDALVHSGQDQGFQMECSVSPGNLQRPPSANGSSVENVFGSLACDPRHSAAAVLISPGSQRP